MNKLNHSLKWIYLLCVAAAAGCTAKGEVESTTTKINTVPVTELITLDTVLHTDYVTDIQAIKHVEVRARVNGYLEKVYVDEGQEVRKGQTLFRISSEEYKAKLAQAEANLKNVIAEALGAELEVKRIAVLVEKEVISTSELGLAKARLEAAKARIEEARSAKASAANRLTYTFVKAPFSGIMDRIPLKQGSLIEEGTLLTTISDLSSVYAYFNVSEKEYLAFTMAKQKGASQNNTAVKLVLADGSPYRYKGEIETMEGVFEANTGSIAFRAKFPNPEKLLKHHSSGKVRLFHRVSDALLVPQKATFEVQDMNYVYVIDKSNKVKIKSFIPKTRFSHFYIVGDGLEPGEKVVYEGLQSIREGTRINPKVVPADSLFPAVGF